MRYQSLFSMMLILGILLFNGNCFIGRVNAQGMFPTTPTPIAAPPPTVVFFTGHSIDTDQYYAPTKNTLCWTWNHIIGKVGSFRVPSGKQLIVIKFTENQSSIVMNNVVCEVGIVGLEPENRIAYIILGEPHYYFWSNSVPYYVGENMQVVTITPTFTQTTTSTTSVQTATSTPTSTITTTPTGSHTPTSTMTSTVTRTSTAAPSVSPTWTATYTSTPSLTATPTATLTQTATPTATPTWTQTPSSTSTQTPSPEPQPTSTIELVLPTRTRQPQRPQVPTPQPIAPVFTANIPAPTSEVNVEIVIPPAVSIVETVESLNMATVEALIETRVAEKPKVENTQTPTKEIKVTATLVPVSNELLDLDSPSLIQRAFDKSLNWFKPKKGDICFGENINNKAKVIAEFTADYFRQIKFVDVKCYSSKDISTVQLFVILTSKGERYEIAIFPEMDIYPAPSSTP